MRTRPALLGVSALTCAAVMVAAGALRLTPVLAQAPAQPKVAVPAAPAAAPAAPPAAAAAPTAAPAAAAPAVDPALKPVIDLVAAFAKAYSEPNIEALVGLFTDEATVVDSTGEEVRGKAAIAEMYAASFEEAPGIKIEAELDNVRFLTPDVARADGRSKISTGVGDAQEFIRFSGLAVRKDGKWRIEELRDYPLPAEDVSTYDRLKELEWMVGDWIDEGSDNKVTSSVKWADNQSFLVRSYQVELQGQKASSGTMFIGWDPATGQIKSWLFDSEGGHGEGLWTRTDDNQWIVKAQGVMRDGRPSSATQIHTVVNKDAVKTSSIDRIVGGQVAADIPEILMVRKAPQPATAKPATPAPAAAPAAPPAR